MDDRSDDFSRPKRLSDLKGGKDGENKEQSYLGKRKNVMDNYQQSEGREKLKQQLLSRKSSINKQGNNQRESRVSNPGETEFAVAEVKSSLPTVAKEELKYATEDAVGAEDEKTEVAHGQSSQGHNAGELETEEGMIDDETLEDHEPEAEDQREGDYDYEQGEDGDYNYEEGENADGEEEYMEDEDGDDFAKKIGVMFS
ncbi:zinc finger CCCH domain-containing protein 17 [Prunus yedoensis var. nudiflora]|uniref:Zinc finger CCCH domain-containing protein 17 n=1 Tax=Prunus yedoensis var. nudiflora TaxID=2094558 RepID=A0A314V077_PRUYE|nr:zinc finger CCCH domain-containing protein 17 [Prunus yedoensis var. nudiflora]